MGSSFVHLHNHTDYSMLDGAANVEKLAAKAAELEMPALAITDHGNLFGAMAFYKAMKKAGVKPIIGLEAYLTPQSSRFERKRVQWGDGGGDDVAASGAYTHMTLWSETTAGMHNLFKLSSYSWIEGYYYKPRADRELLHRYHEGLIATTGCPSGEVRTLLRQDRFDEALRSAAEFQDIFGRDNFFVELMEHGIQIEKRGRDELLEIARLIGAPLVATNDLHYVNATDADAHDSLLCVQSAALKSETNRFHFDGQEYYLKTSQQMRDLFSNHPEACDNTLSIAERCNVEFVEQLGRYMPQLDLPEGHTEESWFRHVAERGLRERYGDVLPAEVRKRADTELDVIVDKHYAGYYLVVADYVGWAKENGVLVGPGRGSGAGSVIAYAMGITGLDPLRFDLLFERFLNPERDSLPDFDVDFDDRQRGRVIDYVTNKYGSERIARMVTVNEIKAKQALRDAARILGKPIALGDRLSKDMPEPSQGKTVSLKQLFDPANEHYAEAAIIRETIAADPEAQQVFDVANGIEGLNRQWGVHAAGVIMSSVPIADVIPVMKRDSDGAIITQFEHKYAEALGLVKMDFLGLSNLTLLGDALDNIHENRDIDISLDELTEDMSDPDVFKLLSVGDTLGVFQLDSDGIRSLLRELKPDSFDDISAVLSLYRPGPMGANAHHDYAARKNHRKPIEPIHRELEETLRDILDPTYGLIVYQEQVQQIALRVAGYSLGKADTLRRAMSKKDKSILEDEYEGFADGMRANGFSDAAISALWDVLLPFSDYAFNKSHTVAYGIIAYWTAYLKAHYPVEYMAALLESAKGDRDKLTLYLNECRRMGIEVQQPDVNESGVRFAAVGERIRFGLSAIKGVGETVSQQMVDSRLRFGTAASFGAFLDHMPVVVCNKRVIEALIKSGAFDSMGHSRRGLMSVFEDAIARVVAKKRNEEFGQSDLFSQLDGQSAGLESDVRVTDIDEWERAVKLKFEIEMLGLSISDHMLRGLDRVLSGLRTHTTDQLSASMDRPNVTLCGLVSSITRKQSRQGDLYAIIDFDDRYGQVRVNAYRKVYSEFVAELEELSIVQIEGRVSLHDDLVEVTAMKIKPVAVSNTAEQPLVIQVSSRWLNTHPVSDLSETLARYPGGCEVKLRFLGSEDSLLMDVDPIIKVEVCDALIADLKSLLGPRCLEA